MRRRDVGRDRRLRAGFATLFSGGRTRVRPRALRPGRRRQDARTAGVSGDPAEPARTSRDGEAGLFGHPAAVRMVRPDIAGAGRLRRSLLPIQQSSAPASRAPSMSQYEPKARAVTRKGGFGVPGAERDALRPPPGEERSATSSPHSRLINPDVSFPPLRLCGEPAQDFVKVDGTLP